MTRCAYPSCNGTLISEPGVEPICMWCARSGGESMVTLSQDLCQRDGCLREAEPGQELCRYHQGSATKAGRVG